MFKVLRFALFLLLIVNIRQVFVYSVKKVQYISTEHPMVTYFNPKFAEFASLTAQRFGRKNPVYYVGVHYKSLTTMGNNMTISFYIYEFLSNKYKRSFIEMHFKYCDFIQKDSFFGAPLRQGNFTKPCPYQPGEYHAVNMTIDVNVIPKVFPFQKGRIYANLTFPSTNEIFANGYIDMELKTITVKVE